MMDDLIIYGTLAVAVFYIMLASLGAGVVYGAYLVLVAVGTGNIALVAGPALIIGILALIYGCTGLVLAKLGII